MMPFKHKKQRKIFRSGIGFLLILLVLSVSVGMTENVFDSTNYIPLSNHKKIVWFLKKLLKRYIQY